MVASSGWPTSDCGFEKPEGASMQRDRRASKTGNGRHNDPREWVWSPAPTHEPLVALDLFRAARAVAGGHERSRNGSAIGGGHPAASSQVGPRHVNCRHTRPSPLTRVPSSGGPRMNVERETQPGEGRHEEGRLSTGDDRGDDTDDPDHQQGCDEHWSKRTVKEFLTSGGPPQYCSTHALEKEITDNEGHHDRSDEGEPKKGDDDDRDTRRYGAYRTEGNVLAHAL